MVKTTGLSQNGIRGRGLKQNALIKEFAAGGCYLKRHGRTIALITAIFQTRLPGNSPGLDWLGTFGLRREHILCC